MGQRFEREGNPYWPLPPDYVDLSRKGQRLARLNAIMTQDTPEDYVNAWSFFRSYYLFPPATTAGMFYKHGVKPSPPAHYQIVHDTSAHQLYIVAAPRSFAKSTLVREMNLMEMLTRAYWEIVLFLAKDQFVMEQMSIYKNIIEHNPRIVDDIGWYWSQKMGIESLKPKRGSSIWSNHIIQLGNGSMLNGLPIKGAALGKRPHAIRCDDVEKDDSLVKEPSDLIEAFQGMLWNVIYPMAEEGCSIGIYGTLLSRRSFLYWLQKTEDPRVADHWHRTLLAVKVDGQNIWPEKMGEEWQERQKSTMGVAKFNAQYMNDPGTEQDRVLTVHDALNTFTVEDMDQAYATDPLNSSAVLASYRCTGYENGESTGRPIPGKVVRPFGGAVSKMYRFITVDWAPTTSDASDYSCIHVMGLENSPDFRDTLWSLDMWLGKERQKDVVRRIYQMAIKWHVRIVGVEAYGLHMELYERLSEDLPQLYGLGAVAPAVLQLKFPPHMEKADKIKGLEWRFNQFRVKLPAHLRHTWPYRELFYQIENFTDDLALLQHDDAIDTLAMHQVIGKPRRQAGPDIYVDRDDPMELLKAGKRSTDYGVPVLSGFDINDIPPDVLQAALDRQRNQRAEAANFQWLLAV